MFNSDHPQDGTIDMCASKNGGRGGSVGVYETRVCHVTPRVRAQHDDIVGCTKCSILAGRKVKAGVYGPQDRASDKGRGKMGVCW